MSPRRVLFWAKCIQAMDGIVSDKDGPTLKVVMPVLVKVILPLNKKVNGPTPHPRGWKTKRIGDSQSGELRKTEKTPPS